MTKRRAGFSVNTVLASRGFCCQSCVFVISGELWKAFADL